MRELFIMTHKLGLKPLIDAAARISNAKLGRYTEIGARTVFENSSLGDYSYIVEDGEVANAVIGKFCSIARAVRINPGNHPMHRASQSHFTYRASRYFEGEGDDEEVFACRRGHPVTIGHDVWIGHGAIILPGRTIGTGAVVGAGAVVTNDVPGYVIAVGVPARPAKRRFTVAQERALLEIAWWDWSHDRLQAALADFRNPNVNIFINKYKP